MCDTLVCNQSRVDAAATATRTSCCDEPRRHMRASPTSSTEPLQCVVGESVKDHWHVDARQEWDQVLRDSGLGKTVHVDTSKSLSDIFTNSVRLYGFASGRCTFNRFPLALNPNARPRWRSFVVQLQQLHIAEELRALMVLPCWSGISVYSDHLSTGVP